MRDRRFVAVHRGGPLAREDHAFLAKWAADCTDHVLPLFTSHSDDDRPTMALKTCRAWARGEVKTGVAMKAAQAAHAAARCATDQAAIAVARSAGHAVATAHAADHCMGALLYALKALIIAKHDFETVLQFHLSKLPPHLLDQVSAGIDARLSLLGIRNGRNLANSDPFPS